MKKIIPLIFTVICTALFSNAQNVTPADAGLALRLAVSNSAKIGLPVELLNTASVASTFEDQQTGIRYVYLQQTYQSIPVHNQIHVLSFRNEKLLTSAGNFDPSIEKMVSSSNFTPSVSAESAVQAALADRGIRSAQMAIAINRKDNGHFVEFGNMGVSEENITARLNWMPNEKSGTYDLAWQVYIISKTTPDYWLVQVSATDTRILGMDNLTNYDDWGTPETNSNIKYPAFAYRNLPAGTGIEQKNHFDFSTINKNNTGEYNGPTLADNGVYRVIPIPFEAPSFMPGPSTTWHAIRNNPWTNAGVLPNAVTLKWHTGAGATDYNYTRGNNVWAYHDRNNQNVGDPARSATSSTALPNLTFDFTPDYTLEPVVTSPPNQQFNITNLFYWNNLIHDIFYAYGFTEVAGNFQSDNLGRGGAGNDHVNAEAQDGSGSNNANFSTPVDGSSGRMQMYLWTAPTPDRDGDVDNGIITHEFGHGIAKRITGGPTVVTCLTSAEQGGEGISDYFGLMLTQDWATATVNTGFNSPRGIGTYALNQPPTGPGIRPKRYTTDFTINGDTYANLPGQAVPHGVGYIWCTMLWEMTWELIQSTNMIEPNIYNFNSNAGNVVALRLVMEGLRTQPCQPGFVDARDHILKADTTLYGGSHYCAIISAFARRGVGIGAQQGSVSSINDQTPSFVGGGAGFAFTQSGAGGVPAGQNITYNHAVTASCAALANYTLRDTLPLNVNFVSATNGGVYTPATRVVAWPVNVAQGATQNYGLTVQIDPGAYFPPVTLINETVPTTTISGFWATSSTTANVWVAHNLRSNSPPNSFFTPNSSSISDQIIATTNSFALGANPPQLKFWHWINSENNFDGGVLEISTNGGTTWTDIGAANIVQNGYNGTLSSSFGNPLGGRQAWTGNSSTFVEVKVNLQPYANQANVKLRWRFGTDNSVTATGWNLDDILLENRAVVNMRTSLFNASNSRVNFKDTVTIILPPAAVPPNVTINQAAAQPDPTSVSPINFTVVFDQSVTGFTTGDVVLSGTAGATTGIVTGSGANYNVAVSGMTSSGTVIATIPAGVCVNATNDPNNASTSTDNTVTYNMPPPLPGCLTTVTYMGPPVNIPDATPAGVDIPLVVSGVGTIADLNFKLVPINAAACNNTSGNVNAAVTHTWNGDLVFKLTSPAATSVTLINRRGSNGDNFCAVTLDDDGSFPPTSTMPTTGAISGNYAPESPLSAFDGQNANGTWILNVADEAGGDIGTVNRFALEFTSVAPTMNPVPNDTVCNGGPAGPYNFSSSTPGVTYSWTNNNPTIGLAASGNGNIPAFTAVNSGTSPVTALVTVTPEVNRLYSVTDSLIGVEPTISPRIFRDAIPSTCASPKVWPGPFGSGSHYYKTYTYTNASANTQCVTITYQSATADQIHVTAYSGSFNPANQATNYLGDGGSSSLGALVTFSVNVASGTNLVLLAFNPFDLQTTPQFTMTVSGLVCPGPAQTFNITVNPSGQVNQVPNQTVCKGQPTAPVNFTTTTPGTIFSWTNNNTSIGLAAQGQGNIPSFIAQNPTSVQQVATITVNPTYGSGGIQQTQTFNFTGAPVSWVVPTGVTSIGVKAWGGQGNSNAQGVIGGLGGYAEGTLAVTPGQTLWINVGGGGTTAAAGGFNGGGAGGVNSGCANANGGGGGGASDVRIGSNTLGARAIVAAGGGGAGGNRVAGCGRGAGGGGGAGYYGGGGGAGWPGVPPGGPVPTGGTQSAGGAGGVTTWTAGGPTNGTAGALGVGGTGGVEVSSNQGGSATATSGGVGGGLTGANGSWNSSNNWTGQSGAGGSSYLGGVSAGVTTSGVNSGNGRVEFNYAAGGLACAGNTMTFTITVNPNASLLIIADPGTVLCEGDPTLLTVYDAAGSTPPGTLYDQTGVAGNGSPSQVFEPANAAFNSQSADDFTVPAGARWTVTRVTALGINSGAGNPTSVNVFFYNNSGSNLPGSVVASYTNLSTFVRTGANYSIDVPSTVLLGGTYWVSVQVNMPFTGQGQWFWGNFGTTNIGNQYAWQNPGGGFGTPCTSWGYGATGCNVGGGVNRNNRFTIYGSSVLPGPQSTGTFLWSPAAGLSSTTTNPVACSPLQTTTYTVRRTTVPGGCIDSAQITITVQQRPRVTASPVNTTVCENGTTTFTVAGVATGITYQWQVSTAGTGGPWANIAPGAPYSGVNGPVLTINPASTLMNGYAYRCILGGVCPPGIPPLNVSAPAVLTVNPLPVIVLNPAGPVCGGVPGINGTLIVAGSAPPPVPGSQTFSSGTISVPIPEGNFPNPPATAAANTIAVSGIPGNATITNVHVTSNISHPYVADVVIVVRAPNGQILNLDALLNYTNNPGANFVNTRISSGSTTALSAGSAPWTGTFRADLAGATFTFAGFTLAGGPVGFTPTTQTWSSLYSTPNGNWTIAAYDAGAPDVGTLTNWSITIDYTTPGVTTVPLTYTWSPAAGLYTNATATTPYIAGTQTDRVYAAPTTNTVYTVTATNSNTGCVNTRDITVVYTPPAPVVNPPSVTMCENDAAVQLCITSALAPSPFVSTYTRTGVNKAYTNNQTGIKDTMNVPLPALAQITNTQVAFNITHTWAGDNVIVLKAPNGQVLNLDYFLSNTGGTGSTSGFTNTRISSQGTALLSSGSSPYNGVFRADAQMTATANGPTGPTGMTATTPNWSALYSQPNGNWILGIYDGFAGDDGLLTSWSLTFNYLLGTPASGVWSPAAGLFRDAAATIPYVAGDTANCVWARPLPFGVYPYQVRVTSVGPDALATFSNNSSITINASGPATPYPSNITVSGLPTTGPSVSTVRLNNLSHTWSNDIDILLQSPTGQNVVLMSDVGGTGGITNATYTFDDAGPAMNPTVVNPTGTYSPTNNGATDNWPAPGPGSITQATPSLSMFGNTANVNGVWKLFVFDDVGGDAGVIAGGWDITFRYATPGCVSPPRTVNVTVNQKVVLNPNLPVNSTVCTDKVATFSVATTAGSAPISYQWQVSTDNGNTWASVSGGVYSGNNAATLTITAPPVSMSGYLYRCIVQGGAAMYTNHIGHSEVNGESVTGGSDLGQSVYQPVPWPGNDLKFYRIAQCCGYLHVVT